MYESFRVARLEDSLHFAWLLVRDIKSYYKIPKIFFSLSSIKIIVYKIWSLPLQSWWLTFKRLLLLTRLFLWVINAFLLLKNFILEYKSAYIFFKLLKYFNWWFSYTFFLWNIRIYNFYKCIVFIWYNFLFNVV